MFCIGLLRTIRIKIKIYIFISVFVITIFHVNESLSQIKNDLQNQSVNADGSIYVDPKKKFSIYIPKEIQVVDTQGAMDLALQSLNGWGVNIQSSPANHSINIKQMVGHFESKYVGPEKPWPQKLSGEILDEYSYSGQYEGSGTRVQVVIKRTPLWDFALMFMAPEDSFISSSVVFQNMLKTFQPLSSNDDNVENPVSKSQDSSSKLTIQDPQGEQYYQFKDQKLGYVVTYPAYWQIKKPDEFTILFTGPSGSAESYVAVSIRNVEVIQPSPPLSIAERMLQQIQTQMAYTDSDVRHDRTFEIDLGQGEYRSRGLQMVSTFRRGHIEYRQWSIAAVRPDGRIVYVWTYTAPIDRFQDYQSIAEKMAGSLAFIRSSAQ